MLAYYLMFFISPNFLSIINSSYFTVGITKRLFLENNTNKLSKYVIIIKYILRMLLLS